MKKIIIVIVTLFAATILAFAQEKKPAPKPHKMEVPQVVLDSFAKKYSAEKDVRWERERKHWEATLKQSGTPQEVSFDSKGNFLYTEYPMQISELMKPITDYVAKRYPDKKILRAEKIIDANNMLMYEVEIKGMHDMFFDDKGGYMNRED